MDDVWTHLRVLLAMGLCGLVLGFLFDWLRVTRSFFRLRKMGTIVLDVLFWGVSTCILGAFALMANYGELRIGVLVGLCMGVALYVSLLSRLVVPALATVGRGFGHVFAQARTIAKVPIIVVGGALGLAGARIKLALGNTKSPRLPKCKHKS